MKKLFFGGVHPKYKKEMSTKNDSLQMVVPKRVVIPMQQHIGAPCVPLVQVGDTVKCGQKIGDAEGLCVPVHASVSGTVVAIQEMPHPTLGKAMAVVIENDLQGASVKGALPNSPDEILQAIREAGIIGMGGAAFPSNVKAMSSMGNVDTLIANGCECEPYITADDTLLRTNPEQILEGMKILAGILKPQRIVLAIEDNKPEAIGKVKAILDTYPEIALQILPTRYPQGSEKQLVQAVTGREIPPGKLPVAVQCAVFNVSTFAAIYMAVRTGKPVTQRIVTVTGEGVANPRNFRVPIGTSFRELVEAAGGLNDTVERVLSGGPMMGFTQTDLDVPVVKATNAVLCLLKDQNAETENSVCLRCGKCVNVCPMRLQPLYIHRYANAECLEQSERMAQLERLHVTDCIECGSCSFTCPGKLPLVESCRKGKKMLKEGK